MTHDTMVIISRVICPLTPMLKAVIFDLDGTLTDSDKVHFQVFQSLFAQHGITLDKSLYKQKISGRQNEAIVADFFPELSAEEGKRFSAQKEALFRERAQNQLVPLPGLLNLLEQIKSKGLATAVVTNAPTKNAVFMLQTLNLADTFDPVVIADELPRGKPDPLPYQTALDRLGLVAADAIAFEDSTAGIRSAVATGIATVGITTTHTADELMQIGAVAAIADFTPTALEPLIDRYFLPLSV
ncbi:MAG: HAD-IA family hydrolase [Cyanobacteria bacterium J06629_19]